MWPTFSSFQHLLFTSAFFLWIARTGSKRYGFTIPPEAFPSPLISPIVSSKFHWSVSTFWEPSELMITRWYRGISIRIGVWHAPFLHVKCCSEQYGFQMWRHWQNRKSTLWGFFQHFVIGKIISKYCCGHGYRDTSLSLRGINPRLSSVEPDLGHRSQLTLWYGGLC